MASAAVAIGIGIVMGTLFIVRGETGPGLGMLGFMIVILRLQPLFFRQPLTRQH
jgi:hypothetical protein